MNSTLCLFKQFLPKDPNGCPYLQLAPMEGVGDISFRKAMASVGGFDEAVRDFLRVPQNAHVKSLASVYQANELSPIPIAAQIMGSNPDLMSQMAHELMKKGALRIDVNCGCPSNIVTGRGAGSSLLKDPSFLHTVAKAVEHAVEIPVTVKMRSGFEDTSLFEENLFAVQESGAAYITIHPRTKVDGYIPPARWDLIAKAKELLKIPIVGNGDILDIASALEMLKLTKCDGLMIGRGAIMNPFLFRQIKAHFSKNPYKHNPTDLINYLNVYVQAAPEDMPMKIKINKLKQLFSFLFKKTPQLLELRQAMLTSSHATPADFISYAAPLLQQGWE